MFTLEVNDNYILVIENGEVVEQYESSENTLTGNIYIGKVKNVLKGMEASFVDIGEKKNALLRNNKYKVGSSILVQVKKDPTNYKGAIVSDKIQLPGKYVILLPQEKYISVSKKIVDKDERNRLKNIVQQNINCGAIVRTGSAGESEKIIENIHELGKKWEQLGNNTIAAPALIYKEDVLKKVIRGLTEKNISKIVTTQKERVEGALKELQLSILVEEGKQNFPMPNFQKERIWLKSGGCIVISKTEALVAIDVNSGSYVGKASFEATAEKVNKEATKEIAKQIRLRNLRGIIIVDYINVQSEEAKNEIISLMEQETKKDRSKVEVYGFTKLGLLEMTRKSL